MTNTNTATTQVARPVKLSGRLWLAIALFLVIGVAYLLVRDALDASPQVTVFGLTREVAPYEKILPEHVVRMEFPLPRDVPVALSRDQLEGRYALTSLPANKPITLSSVGPLAPVWLERSLIFSIGGDATLSLNGRLRRGDQVDILLPSSANDPVSGLQNLFVLDTAPAEQGSWIITLASPQSLEPSQASILAHGRVAVVRRPPP